MVGVTEPAAEEAGALETAASVVQIELVTVEAPAGALVGVPVMVCVTPLTSTETVRGKTTVGGAEAVGCGVLNPSPKISPRIPKLLWELDAPWLLEFCDCGAKLSAIALMMFLLTVFCWYLGLSSCASGASCAATRSRPPIDRKAARAATVVWGSMIGQLPGR